MKVKIRNIILLIVLGLLTLGFLMAALGLHRETMIDWWKPMGIALVVAVLPGLALGRALDVAGLWRETAGSYITGVVVATAMALGGFYLLNYFYSEPSSHETIDAAVIDKYRKQHYQVKRISRHTNVRGRPYWVYFIVLDIPGKGEKVLNMPLSQYNNVKKGGSVKLEMERGMMGVPVIKEKKIVKDNSKTKRKKFTNNHNQNHNH